MTAKRKLQVGGTLVATFVMALIIFAFTIPRDFHYEKKIDVIAQQRMVFVFIGELQRWKEWTRWAAQDPDMRNTFSEPSWGVGATYHWNSRSQGQSDIKVTSFTSPSHMGYDLTTNGWEPSRWEFKLGPASRQGTTVVWSVAGQYPENRFMRLAAYIMLWNLPNDIERSLERLKKHAELHEAYQVKGGWE